MDYDEFNRSHVEFEVGALYRISYLSFWRYSRDNTKMLTLYIRMGKYITKVETNVTER